MIKLHVLSPDAKGTIDGSLQTFILVHLAQTSISACDAVVVPIAYHPNYEFNPLLYSLRKPVILLDFLEFGWDAGSQENRLGHGIDFSRFGHLDSAEWRRLDDWVRNTFPTLIFKRELFERDRAERVFPIEFPCCPPIPALDSETEFNSRPMEVFSCWGLSHPVRQRLHGEIFRNAHGNFHVVDNWNQKNHFEGRTWATIHSPYYARQPREEVMRWNMGAKISVSLPGAGVCCFRHAEAPCGSIMALRQDSKAWSVPWIDGENCIRLVPDDEFASLEAATHRPDLYEIYRRGQESAAKYRPHVYAQDYILPAIQAIL